VQEGPQIWRQNAIRSSISSPRKPTRSSSSGHRSTTGEQATWGEAARERRHGQIEASGSGSPTTLESSRGDGTSRRKSLEESSQRTKRCTLADQHAHHLHHGSRSSRRKESRSTPLTAPGRRRSRIDEEALAKPPSPPRPAREEELLDPSPRHRTPSPPRPDERQRSIIPERATTGS
jgi:hypothetical protein